MIGTVIRESAHWLATVARGVQGNVKLRRAANRLSLRRRNSGPPAENCYGPPDGREWDVSSVDKARRFLIACEQSPQVAFDPIAWCANHNPSEFRWWIREQMPWKARTSWCDPDNVGRWAGRLPPLPCAYCGNPLAFCGCDPIVCAECHWPSNRCVCGASSPPAPVGVDTFVDIHNEWASIWNRLAGGGSPGPWRSESA